MNQKTVIYIILSAILLYLYYRKGDLAIFVAFVVVVTGTLILGKGGSVEGFGKKGKGKGGGGGGCSKLGFKEVKIDKKNINGSLKKIFANFKTVTSKYVNYNDKSAEPKEEYKTALDTIGNIEIIKSEMEKINKVEENQGYVMAIMFGSMFLLQPYLIKTDEESRTKFMKSLKEFKNKDEKTGLTVFESILKGGELGSKILEKIKKSDELKESDKEVKKVFSVIECAFKQVLAIWKELDKAVVKGDGGDEGGDGDGGDGGDGDDEGKKKKKKKKADDEGDGDGGGDDE